MPRPSYCAPGFRSSFLDFSQPSFIPRDMDLAETSPFIHSFPVLLPTSRVDPVPYSLIHIHPSGKNGVIRSFDGSFIRPSPSSSQIIPSRLLNSPPALSFHPVPPPLSSSRMLLARSLFSPLRLLFCHGLGSTKADAHLVQEWARSKPQGLIQLKILKYEHYGESAAPVWMVDNWVRDIARQLAAPSADRPDTVAVCVSAGAQALLRALHRSPELGRRALIGLVLVSPGVHMCPDNYIRRVLPAFRPALSARLPVPHPSSDPALPPIPITLDSLEDYAQNCVLCSDRPFAPMDFPIRIVHGLHDKLVPWQNSVELLDRLPAQDKALHIVPSGHMITDTAILRHELDSVWAAAMKRKKTEEDGEEREEGEKRRAEKGQ